MSVPSPRVSSDIAFQNRSNLIFDIRELWGQVKEPEKDLTKLAFWSSLQLER